MEPKGYIEDGYTRRSSLLGRHNSHPSLKFDWRPTSARKRSSYYKFMSDMDLEEENEALGNILEKHILSWDFPKDPTSDNIRELHPLLFTDLVQVVVFMEKSPDEEFSLTGNLEVKAKEYQQTLEEYLAKNSEKESVSST